MKYIDTIQRLQQFEYFIYLGVIIAYLLAADKIIDFILDKIQKTKNLFYNKELNNWKYLYIGGHVVHVFSVLLIIFIIIVTLS